MAGGFLAMRLWGKLGVFAFWELINITDPIDAFIPSLTLIGLISVLREPLETLRDAEVFVNG